MSLIPENSADAMTLESLLDQHGVHNVLAALCDICNAKADHVRTNWQDAALAKAWEKNARLIDTARHKSVATS